MSVDARQSPIGSTDPRSTTGDRSSAFTPSAWLRFATALTGAAAATGSLIAAVGLDDAVAWSAFLAVVAWATVGLLLAARRPGQLMSLFASGVALAVAIVTVVAALAGDGVGTWITVASVPTALGLLLVSAPDGRCTRPQQRRAMVAIVAAGIVGGAALAMAASDVPVWLVVAVVLLTVGPGALVAATTCRKSSVVDRARLQWLGWGLTVSGCAALAAAAVLGVSGRSDLIAPVAAAIGAVAPIGLVLGSYDRMLGEIGGVLVHTIVTIGLVVFVAAVYAVVVVGLSGVPDDSERTVLALSILAACVVAVTVVPVRRRLLTAANERVRGDDTAPDHALDTFSQRMSRAIPMDELMLQLVEALKKSMHLSSAEVWTGSDGRYELTVSVPHGPRPAIELGPEATSVASRAHVQGNAWLSVWVPDLLDGRDDRAVRCTSVAHLGELLGFIVTERPAGDAALDEEDEHQVLVDIARQLGLALHNVRLDNALQASLDDLKVANDELVASRARIVSATDESRRRIERNLHDGAQQHLVALAVKVGLVRQLIEADPATAEKLLEELRDDVQVTLTELRELAHGIYPPRLRDRGLADALQAAADRSPLPTHVEADGLGRYGPDIETAIYFCCLEAIQNAGKHAGEQATIRVAVGEADSVLEFSVADDGAGFDPATQVTSSGFVNMRDRLGAFSGDLEVTSSPGGGTTVRGRLPLR